MKLNLSENAGQAMTGYGPGYLVAGGQRYEHALLVSHDAPPRRWPLAGINELRAELLAPLLTGEVPEIVLIGTGKAQLFPDPAVLQPLIEARVGIEIMNTAAACRTFNVLLSEGRRVAAALCCPEPE